MSFFNLNQNLITVEGTSWWRWPVKKLSDGGVFFDKHFAYFFANEKVRKTMNKIEGMIFKALYPRITRYKLRLYTDLGDGLWPNVTSSGQRPLLLSAYNNPLDML